MDNDDAVFIDADAVEGYHWYPCSWVVWLKEGEPLCDVDDLVREIATRSIKWHDAADEADRYLDKILHMRRENDLRIGEVLTLFKKKKGDDYLGHRSIGTFAVEHMSFSGRLASELMHNHEVLSTLPLSKKAYPRGKLMKSALRHLSRVLTPENEAEWLSKAQNLSLNALEEAVREALNEKGSADKSSIEKGSVEKGSLGIDDGNGDIPENGITPGNVNTTESSNNHGMSRSTGKGNTSGKGDTPGNSGSSDHTCGDDDCTQCAPPIPSEESDEKQKGVMMHFNVSKRLAPVWDFALQHFRDKEQYSGPISGFIEALLANFIASGRGTGDNSQSQAENPKYPIFHRCHMRAEEAEESGEDPSLDDSLMPAPMPDEKHQDGSQEEHSRLQWCICFPPSFYQNPDTVEGLAAKLIELASNRQTFDVAMGKLLWAIRDWGLYRPLGYEHIEEYGKKRCDLPKPLLYRLMRVAEGFRRHPLIENAFRIGLLSREQARLILRIVNENNERIWIDYAAHAPTVELKEEVERCTRIVDYDHFAPAYYNILPGFRYITNDRFYELPEEMKEIIRTGSWYSRSSPELSWPLEENDEDMVLKRDPRLEEPWNYFEDVDEFLEYEAEMARKRKRTVSAVEAYGGLSCPNLENFLCARHASSGREAENSLCARQVSSGQETETSLCVCHASSGQEAENSLCACHNPSEKISSSPSDPDYSALSNQSPSPGIAISKLTCCDDETLSKAKELCTMPHGENPAETFLLDILEDDSSSRLNTTHRLKWGQTPFSFSEESILEKKESVPGMPIRFFLPEELYELWNVIAMIYLDNLEASGAMDFKLMGLRSIHELPTDDPGLYQGFIAALLYDYLSTERIHLKLAHHYAILKRDRFRCQVPGCNCRRNLHVHHIIWRSKGGTDDPVNLIVLCARHHFYILHNLLTLKIEGTAPHNLTFTFGPKSCADGKPFLKYINGRKVLMAKI
ncbi:MAG: HNH endonuclease [Vulcanimicrobiota bacterium]